MLIWRLTASWGKGIARPELKEPKEYQAERKQSLKASNKKLYGAVYVWLTCEIDAGTFPTLRLYVRHVLSIDVSWSVCWSSVFVLHESLRVLADFSAGRWMYQYICNHITQPSLSIAKTQILVFTYDRCCGALRNVHLETLSDAARYQPLSIRSCNHRVMRVTCTQHYFFSLCERPFHAAADIIAGQKRPWDTFAMLCTCWNQTGSYVSRVPVSPPK